MHYKFQLLLQFNVDSSNATMFEDSGFDLRSMEEDEPVRQMEWLKGTNFIIAITNTSVSYEISQLVVYR